jgi:dual specificity MAP kinase phosphatase
MIKPECMEQRGKREGIPEAYLDLQVGKRRSFFVYQHDMGVMRRVETRLIDDRERERERERVMRERMEMERMVREREQQQQHQKARSFGEEEQEELNANGKRTIGSVHNMSGSEGKSGG